MKHKLYIAVPGCYDSTLTNNILTPMVIDETHFHKSIRAIKKELKYSNVVIKATESIFGKIKLPYVFVRLQKGLENMLFYRYAGFLTEKEKYDYPLLLVRLNLVKQKTNEIVQLSKTEFLHEYLERVEAHD